MITLSPPAYPRIIFQSQEPQFNHTHKVTFNRFQGLRRGSPLVYLLQSLLTTKCKDMGQMQNSTWKFFHCYKVPPLIISSSERPKGSGQRAEFLLDMRGHSSRKEVRNCHIIYVKQRLHMGN